MLACVLSERASTLQSDLMRSYNVRARKSSDHIKMPLSTVRGHSTTRSWSDVDVRMLSVLVVSDFIAMDIPFSYAPQ